jgi:hypothetical protein
VLYDQGENEAALYHFERTKPEDHWDELGIWRLMELKRSLYRLGDNDPELKPWEDRLAELAGDLDDVDTLLMELDAPGATENSAAPESPRGQLELFGTLLSTLAEQRQGLEHQIIAPDGSRFAGSWDDIVRRLRDETGNPTDSVREFMDVVSKHGFRQTGVRIPTNDAESFIRGSAIAGLLRIVR